MNNAIDEHVHNKLPIYLLHLKDMKLLRRPAIKGVLQSTITHFIEEYLSMNNTGEWMAKTKGEVRSLAKEWIIEQTPYAIFSHRWLEKGELNFQDILAFEKLGIDGFRRLKNDQSLRNSAELLARVSRLTKGTTQGTGNRNSGMLAAMKQFCDRMSPIVRENCADFVKVVEFCATASQHGAHFVWFDTGCIDKTRSAELEESIRSMFSWYRNSYLCIIHLAETTSLESLKSDPWFTRGWTLQELLAPKRVLFYGKSWRRVTPKRLEVEENDKVPDDVLKVPLWDRISKITGIPIGSLLNFTPGIIHARNALTWVSKRQTTRTEDIAYCLIGVLDIPLSIAYGEGSAAFYRLQVEILQRSDDIGLFAWHGQPATQSSMLAAAPDCFAAFFPHPSFASRNENSTSDSEDDSIDQTYSMTNRGLRIWLPSYSVLVLNEDRAADKSEVTKIRLEVEGMGSQFDLEMCDLAQYKRLELVVLGRVLDGQKEFHLAILLGRSEGRWSRVVTKERILLPFRPPTKEPKLRFIK